MNTVAVDDCRPHFATRTQSVSSQAYAAFQEEVRRRGSPKTKVIELASTELPLTTKDHLRAENKLEQRLLRMNTMTSRRAIDPPGVRTTTSARSVASGTTRNPVTPAQHRVASLTRYSTGIEVGFIALQDGTHGSFGDQNHADHPPTTYYPNKPRGG